MDDSSSGIRVSINECIEQWLRYPKGDNLRFIFDSNEEAAVMFKSCGVHIIYKHEEDESLTVGECSVDSSNGILLCKRHRDDEDCNLEFNGYPQHKRRSQNLSNSNVVVDCACVDGDFTEVEGGSKGSLKEEEVPASQSTSRPSEFREAGLLGTSSLPPTSATFLSDSPPQGSEESIEKDCVKPIWLGGLVSDLVLAVVSVMGEALQCRDIDHRQAYNCEIMLSKLTVSLHDLVDEIDILWKAKDQFPKDFRAEILFSEMDAAASAVAGDISSFEEEGLPVEAFAKVQEFFS
ncbi:hypothetical protein I3842_15G156100 [Carya illinoinensis]|uniref:Uncharacterized protein n=1 Tax=Carya illinoinensis TaxID=32201 RepID=A0A922AD14_CARIL|nr:hypothetical protein I3842_15G156100 [Carya illinoinensis]